VAALITALVGAAALIFGLRETGDPPPADDPPTISPTVSPGPGSSGEGPAGSRTVVMASGDELDVETNTVGNAVPDAEVRFSIQSGINYLQLRGARHSIIDSWTNQAGCVEALRQRSDDTLTGDRFGDSAVCILTMEDNVAQILPSRPDDSRRITVHVITWR
jgi:hypothetical protein